MAVCGTIGPLCPTSIEKNESFSGAESDDEQEGEALRQEMWALFGLPAPKWEDESGAPPITAGAENDLRLLMQGRLPVYEKRRLYDLIVRFRSWSETCAKISAEDFRKGCN